MGAGWALCAKRYGDPGSVETAQAARSTQGKSMALFGDTSSDDPEPVWVVQIRGSFVCSSCLGMAGGPTAPPSGQYAVLIIPDPPVAGGGQAFADKPYDLSKLGHVYDLTPPPTGVPTQDPFAPSTAQPGSATVEPSSSAVKPSQPPTKPSQTTGGPGFSPEEGALLYKLASTASTDNGGTGVPRVDTIRTTHRAAAEFLSHDGAGVSDPDEPVWLIQVHGTFVCQDCEVPSGAAPPTGSVLTIVIANLGAGDMTKYGVAGTIYEFGVAEHAYDLSAFGVVGGMVP